MPTPEARAERATIRQEDRDERTHARRSGMVWDWLRMLLAVVIICGYVGHTVQHAQRSNCQRTNVRTQVLEDFFYSSARFRASQGDVAGARKSRRFAGDILRSAVLSGHKLPGPKNVYVDCGALYPDPVPWP